MLRLLYDKNHLKKMKNNEQGDVSVLIKKIEETESNSRSKIEALMSHSHCLQLKRNKMTSNNIEASSLVNNPNIQFNSNSNTNTNTNESMILELDALRTENNRLHNIISEMEKENRKTVIHQNNIIKKLSDENKEVKQLAEKKINETAGELCKNLEDQIRMMSRRIKVVEQLHIENNEVYMKTRDKYSKEKTDMIIIEDMMKELNRVGVKFEEFSDDIMKRVSMFSCWDVFAKEWARKKGMEEKEREEEIMELRERVKEIEKVVNEKEEEIAMIGEEKKEAIRQLCVWTDYHRNNRRGYLKETVSRNRRNFRILRIMKSSSMM
ncbi:COP1-interactive protein 1-like [Impatiens glandulifera]|uniref:COP1-interactive protein 1-like n=1 Tax=Impatiens glandulifera TaxID=253017 RepID=UPI001FB14A44|nr:COP1-interactive protein 1-like [Impatiens glandulifera]